MQNTIEVLWEYFYHTKPLTFLEFVQEFKSLKHLFPVVKSALKNFDERSKDLSSYPGEIYVQGAVGIGKGMYCYLVFLYRVYLFLLLKEPRQLIGWAPPTPITAAIIGPRSDETLKGIIHFIQSTGSATFEISSATDKTVKADCWLDYDEDGNPFFESKYGNRLFFKAIKTQVDLIGIQPAVNYFESDDYELYNTLVTRVRARFGLEAKPFLSTIIVDKFPNNLYSDLLDQTIKEKENEDHALVERFSPLFYKYCDNYEEVSLYYMININNGLVEKLGPKVAYEEWKPFPKEWKGTDLHKLATDNPESFIKDILGIPLPSPLAKDYRVTDSLSALQAARNLIRDYNMQISFDSAGFYLSIPNVNTKIKVY